MDIQTAESLLFNALQPDENIRSEAEKTIKSFIQDKYPEFLCIFAQIMLNPSSRPNIRFISSIIMKNSFHSKDHRIQKNYENLWLSCPENIRNEFKNILQANLNCKEKQILSNISKILGSIARIELNNSLLSDFFKRMLMIIPNLDFAIGALEACKSACSQLYDETEYSFDNDKEYIFRIVIFYLSQPAPKNVILSNLSLIDSSLEILDYALTDIDVRYDFIHKLFKLRENDEEVLEALMPVLNTFFDIYHSHLNEEVDIFCEFFNSYINNDSVIIHTFDFWLMIADLKFDSVVKKNFHIILPKLFSCLTKEDPDDSNWTPHKAASSLLVTLTDEYNSGILLDPYAQQFISSNLSSSEPENRALGSVALASVCQKDCSQFISSSLPILIHDIESHVASNEALYAIARICEIDPLIIIESLNLIIEKLNIIITVGADSAENAVWVIYAIASSIKHKNIVEMGSIFNFHYINIINALFTAFEKTPPEKLTLRNAVNTTLSEVLSACPNTINNVFDNIVNYFFNKITELISIFDPKNKKQSIIIEDYLSSCIVLLQVTLSMKKSIDPLPVANLFINCLKGPKNASFGEIYIATSKLIKPMSLVLNQLMPFVIRDIESRDHFVLKSALNLLSDIAVEMGPKFSEFTSTAIPALVNSISSTHTPLELKANVISVFGTVALAIGEMFEPYLEMAIVLFTHINALNRVNDEEYVDSLRKSILELFSCVFLAIGAKNELRNNLKKILEHIKVAIFEDKDGVFINESVSLLEDIKSLFGINSIDQEWIRSFLLSVYSGKDDAIAQKARKLYNSYY